MMRLFRLCVVMIAAVAPRLAAAQAPRAAAPGSVQSLVQGPNKDEPVQIEAATLEVRDKSKMATFSGNVQVVQGDTTMRCQILVVFYGQEVGLGGGAPAPAPAAKNDTNT